MEKVSIIMPCYNDGEYIREAIESIKQQTYGNWELIIIDDGSDDPKTVRIIDDIQDAKIRIFHTEHLRPAGARNYGINYASGKYILPVDSDDKIHPTYIEKALELMESNSNIGIVYCKAELFGEKTGAWDLPDYSFPKMLLDNIVFVTALFYKEDWKIVGGFSTSMVAGMEDYDFWLSILGLGRNIYQIPEILFYYRIKPTSRTTSFQNSCEQVQDTYRQMYLNHKEFYHNHFDEYALTLRDALIEQIFLRRKYEERWDKIVKICNYPIIGGIVKKLFRE